MDMYAHNQLEQRHAREFRSKIDNQPALHRKYLLHLNLSASTRHSREQRVHRLAAAGSVDEQEEEQLREILREVIRKTEAEKEASAPDALVDKVRMKLTGFLEQVDQWIGLHRGQIRLATALATVAIIFGFAWLVFSPGEQDHVANKPAPPAKNDRMVAEAKTPGQEEPGVMGDKAKERIIKFIVSQFEFEKIFSTYVMRGEEPTATGVAYTKASDYYNIRQYDSCAVILKDLLKRKAITDRDSISEMYFYLGNCYLIKGVRQNNPKMTGLALQAFDSVGRQSYFYKPSRFYSVFARAKLGDPETSLKILDTLAMQTYGRQGKVRMMRDSASLLKHLPD
jgi:hypothetical protein